jgi:hypothetical protein
MPFIAPKCRDRVNKGGIKACEEVGDICYVFYKHFVSAWKLEPRWRTAHRLYRDSIKDRCSCSFYAMVCTELAQTFSIDDVDTALSLAWQVFFQRFVMPYELEKIDQNGDIQ